MNFSNFGIVVDVLIALIIVGNAVYNYRKGFANILLSFLSLILSVLLVFILYRPVSNYIYEKTDISENLRVGVHEKLEEKFSDQDVSQISSEQSGLIYHFIQDEANNIISDEKDKTIDKITNIIVEKMIMIAVFVIMFVVIRLIFFILRKTLHILTKMPIVGFVDSLGGMIYGVIIGFLTIYIIFAILSLVFTAIGDNFILTAIDKSNIGNRMYYDNFLLKIIL